MLRYKAECADNKLVEVNPRNTSQTCVCDEPNKKDLSVRRHHCKVCGVAIHLDICSAKVILKLGLGLSLETLTYQVADCVVSESPSITASV